MKYPIDKYKSQAATTFASLFQTFKGWGNGWQVGNVFDTLTDYVVRFPDAEPSRGAVAEAALERWGKIQSSMCWYDDYGWWGIASAKAFDDRYADVFGSRRSEFQKIATDCWDVMHTGKPDKPPYKYKGGPRVWENRDEGKPPGYFTSPDTWAVPRFPGGVWQYDMFKDERKHPPDCTPASSNPSDPNSCLLGPFQNTVMNGLYFVLALRLRDKGTGAAEAAKTEMAFLNEWFSLEGDESLLWRFDDRASLVRERVSTYAYCEEKKSYPGVQGYLLQGAWGGDQGLLLGGLLDYPSVEPSDKTAQALAVDIARGVLLKMVNDEGIMPYSSGFNDQGDSDDYSCGLGVFCRYLLWGFGQNDALRTEVLSMVANDPENNSIYKSATNPRAHAPSGNALFADFNALATLTAAIEILSEAGG